PDGPTIATSSRGWIAKLTPRSAVTGGSDGYVLVTASSSSTGTAPPPVAGSPRGTEELGLTKLGSSLLLIPRAPPSADRRAGPGRTPAPGLRRRRRGPG